MFTIFTKTTNRKEVVQIMLAFLFLITCAVSSNAACSTNVTFGIRTGVLNGSIGASLNGVTVNASGSTTNCYGEFPVEAIGSVDLEPNKKYTLTLTWGAYCLRQPVEMVLSNSCACFGLSTGPSTGWGNSTNGGWAFEVVLAGTNSVLFGSNPLVPDGVSTTIAWPENLASLGSNIVWGIKDPSLGCKILSTATNGEWCIVQSGTNEGTITVTATGSTGCEAAGNLDLKKCSGCSSGSCEVGEASAGLGSVDYSIKLGRAGVNGSAGEVHIKANQPSMDLYSAKSLAYNYISTNVHVMRDASNVLQQIWAPQVMLNVVSNSTLKYTLDLYQPTNISGFSNGLYLVSGTPFAVFTVENPDGTGGTSNRVRITESRDGNTRIADYAVTNGNWHLTTGNGLKVETESTTVASGIRTVTKEIRSGSGSLVSITTLKYQAFSWGEGLIEEVRGSGPSSWINTFDYHTNGMVRQASRGDGSWTYNVYDNQWRPLTVYSSWLGQAPSTNSALCRVTENSYDASVVSGSGDDSAVRPHIPRRVIEYVAGTEVSRRYNVNYYLSETNELLIQEIRCQTAGAAWNASDNLVTYILHFAEGPYRGQPRLIVHPDRNAESYSYTAGTNGYTTTTHQSGLILFSDFITYLDLGGLPAVFDTDVEFGTEQETTSDALGVVLSRTNRFLYDGSWSKPADKFDTGWEVFSGFDASLRPTRVDYMDGTYSLTGYGCCGVQTFTNREGTVTSFGMDALKRRVTTLGNGITQSNLLDAAGNTLASVRFGTDNSVITNSSSTFDTAGQLLSSTDALGNTTTYTNYFDGSGYLVRQTTYPGGGTRVERYYRDGSLFDVSGTTAYPLSYAYGVTNDSAGRLYSVEQRGSEWTMTVNNMLGQHHKTVYAAASSPFPYSQSYYDSVSGKRVKQVDPDGNVTLFFEKDGVIEDYDFTHGYTETAIDVDRNNAVGYSGTDRITGSYLEPVTGGLFDGFSFYESRRTVVWTTDSSSATADISVVNHSPDGLRTIQVQNGLTNSSWTVYAGSGTRYVTNTAPDGTYTVNTYQDGRVISTETRNTSLGTLNQLTYGYDSHGRQSSMTNVATGTITSSLYDKADHLITNTITASGLSAQTTANFFDERGRIWRTLLPDGTSVTNEFYTTGLLKKTSGSRTYPVQYGYDSQGRMTNMTTWQDFATGSGAALTTWKYDGYRGFMTNKLYADGNGTGYAYTNSGRLVKRIWARGVTTSYGYNNAGDLSVMDYSDSTPDVTYTYNRRGWQSIAAQGTTNTTYTYNTAGSLLSEAYSGGPLSGLSVQNGYDSLLRRVTNNLWNGSTKLAESRYTYDAASRLFAVSDGTNSASYRYLTNSGIVSQIAFTNATALRMITTRQFDGLYRLTNTVSSNASAVVVSAHGYQYNAANQRTLTTREDGSYWVYQYDSLGQVTSGKKYWSDGTPVAGQQFEYGFDDIGNRETAGSGGDQFGANLRVENYSVNSLNQYTQRTVPGRVDVLGAARTNGTVTVNLQPTYRKGEYFRAELTADNAANPAWFSVTNIGALKDGANPDIVSTNTGNVLLAKAVEVFTHDADGNLTSDSLWTNSWNGGNRWTAAETRSTVSILAKRKVEFSYDHQGRRIQKTISTNNGTAWVSMQTNKFLYDGWKLLAELNGANNAVVRSYLWGLDLSDTMQGVAGIGGAIAVNAGSDGVHFYVPDRLGNVIALVSASNSTITASYEYETFGRLLRAQGPAAKLNPLRWSTKYWDEETSTSYYGDRYYVPATGRWLNRDPFEEFAGPSLYVFNWNNPQSFIDPDGLAPVPVDDSGKGGYIPGWGPGDYKPSWPRFDPTIGGLGGPGGYRGGNGQIIPRPPPLPPGQPTPTPRPPPPPGGPSLDIPPITEQAFKDLDLKGLLRNGIKECTQKSPSNYLNPCRCCVIPICKFTRYITNKDDWRSSGMGAYVENSPCPKARLEYSKGMRPGCGDGGVDDTRFLDW